MIEWIKLNILGIISPSRFFVDDRYREKVVKRKPALTNLANFVNEKYGGLSEFRLSYFRAIANDRMD